MLFLPIVMAAPANAVSSGIVVSETDPIRAVTVSVYGSTDDCTGVKVAAKFVITARHCQVDKTTRITFANGDKYTVAASYMPPMDAVEENDLDLVLLEVDHEVPGPIAEIADDASTPKNGSIVWIAGLGGQKITKKRNPLRKLPATISDRNFSSSAISVRAQRGGGVCDGDSGGPGYTELNGRIVLWGIDSGSVSENSTCAKNEVFFKISSQFDWINAMLSRRLSRGVR